MSLSLAFKVRRRCLTSLLENWFTEIEIETQYCVYSGLGCVQLFDIKRSGLCWIHTKGLCTRKWCWGTTGSWPLWGRPSLWKRCKTEDCLFCLLTMTGISPWKRGEVPDRIHQPPNLYVLFKEVLWLACLCFWVVHPMNVLHSLGA